jgi:photosystem II stability/assembly factor-like uncharacterized protein
MAVASLVASAQTGSPWQMQNSGTTAGLRGIHSVDGTVAWASGTGGTVLRTTDGGAHWEPCTVPDAATDGATLDFRGVHAWDAQTAIVMASGPGEKSRLYKTKDAKPGRRFSEIPTKKASGTLFNSMESRTVCCWAIRSVDDSLFSSLKTVARTGSSKSQTA